MNVGILGGGQLGRMLALAAHSLGLRPVVFATAEGPATEVAPGSIIAPWDDDDALKRFADMVEVATYEIEHLPVDAAWRVASRTAMRPSVRALEVAGDRLREKRFLASLGVPLAPWIAVEGEASYETVASDVGFPCIVKRRVQGYDGLGQARVARREDLAAACLEVGGPAVAEARVTLVREVSTLAVRGADGAIAWFDPVQNVHIDGILHVSRAPAHVPAEALDAMRAHHERVLIALDYVGVLTVEWFETPDGWLANELAPRVHNSGHWTIEGAEASQFEQHIRAVAGLPLGSAATRGSAAMVNFVGTMPDRAAVLSIPGASLHDYRKTARRGRKLGHATVCAVDDAALAPRLAALEALAVGR